MAQCVSVVSADAVYLFHAGFYYVFTVVSDKIGKCHV